MNNKPDTFDLTRIVRLKRTSEKVAPLRWHTLFFFANMQNIPVPENIVLHGILCNFGNNGNTYITT